MSNADIFVGETIGTAILILFGAGVCAAVTLKHSNAHASGWIVIAFGWGFAVLACAYTAAPLSGGHLKPILAFGLTEGLGESGTLALIVALLVVGIGLSLGGPTGYAVNPARDLGPRIVHSLLPIPNKGTSDWGYAWVPVAGPLIGGAPAGLVHNAAF
ncbi:MIP/aquaporin family protein [Streptomyces pharetrae]|uniref:MIP/aquaporin family protein n=1 Tax=Streptomyces pharetrae TaxID=291370 RepID=UPI003648EC49